MKLMLLLPLLLIFLHQPLWKFRFFLLVHASPDPLLSLPPASLLIPSPISSSMAAFSPGPQLGFGVEDHHQMKLDKRVALLLFVAIGSLAMVIAISLFCCLYFFKFTKKRKNAQCSDMEKGISLKPSLCRFNSLKIVGDRGSAPLIEYEILEKGSSNFGDGNLLGKGGFGQVYKALLDDKTCVAVKKLVCENEHAIREFQNEVDLLNRIHHPNIISILGYSVHEDMGFIVYELMQNGSLEDLLHGPSHGSSLNWHMRLKIALDTARGLEYLHEYCKPAVIHRDLKSSNILLDSKFNAKLSDFGLAVLSSSSNQSKLKLSGTVGYVAPEYLLNGELTDKSDVYAFGVVLLELLLGRRPVEKLAPTQCQSIVTWAMPQLTDRALLPNIVDPAIKDTVDEKYLFQVAAVAVLCVQPEPSYRPLITDVVHSLVPLVPLELGGTLRVARQPRSAGHQHS